MKKILVSILAVGTVILCHASPAIKEGSVVVSQGATRRVTVNYTLEGTAGYITVDVLTNGVSIGGENIRNLSGDVNKLIQPGDRTFVWNPLKSWPNHVIPGEDLQVAVTAWDTFCPPEVLVFDLTEVPYAISCYANIGQLPGGVQDRVYKTDKLVIRRIPAEGVTWKMGSPKDEPCRPAFLWGCDYERQHKVTFSADFYMGVYEVTQRQYKWVMGTQQAKFKNPDCWETRPMENIDYDNDLHDNKENWPCGRIDDGGNPVDRHAVSSGTFFYYLRERTELNKLDLPTEAQWEYACRAGSPKGCNNFLDMSAENMNTLGRYAGNGGLDNGSEPNMDTCTTEFGTAEVGSYEPNAWNLYDMQGNVWEWCLDAYNWDFKADGEADVTDPVGGKAPVSGHKCTRTIRGGSWADDIGNVRCASRCRQSKEPSAEVSYGGKKDVGFRVCLHLD